MTSTTEQAVIVEQSEAEYHADKTRLSRSQLVDFLKSPRNYKMLHVDHNLAWKRRASAALDFGRTCHQAIFVDRDATRAFAVIPDDVLNHQGHKRGPAWMKWKKENAGKHHLLADEGAKWLEMWASIQDSEPASKLLMGNYAGSREEFTIHWTHDAINLRCRIDRVVPTWALVDLKTIHNADERLIVREITDRKLYIQAAIYRWAWYLVSGVLLPFVFVFVEKEAPFRTVCREVPADWIEDGMAEVYDGLQRLQVCADFDHWPRQTDDQIRTIVRPRYQTKFQESY